MGCIPTKTSSVDVLVVPPSPGTGKGLKSVDSPIPVQALAVGKGWPAPVAVDGDTWAPPILSLLKAPPGSFLDMDLAKKPAATVQGRLAVKLPPTVVQSQPVHLTFRSRLPGAGDSEDPQPAMVAWVDTREPTL